MDPKRWKKWEEDPDNPVTQKDFRKTALHVIKESEQLYSHLKEWLLAQSHFTADDIEMIRKLDEFNDLVNDSLLGGMIISRYFGGISVQAPLIKDTPAQQIMKKHDWKVIDIQFPIYKLDRKELIDLVDTIAEAADQSLNETSGYILQRESMGLLVLKNDKKVQSDKPEED